MISNHLCLRSFFLIKDITNGKIRRTCTSLLHKSATLLNIIYHHYNSMRILSSKWVTWLRSPISLVVKLICCILLTASQHLSLFVFYTEKISLPSTTMMAYSISSFFYCFINWKINCYLIWIITIQYSTSGSDP